MKIISLKEIGEQDYPESEITTKFHYELQYSIPNSVLHENVCKNYTKFLQIYYLQTTNYVFELLYFYQNIQKECSVYQFACFTH
jgi:hypothetical protein